MQKDQDHAYTNELIHESSPYLLQHAHNPVNWFPWGEEALNKAKSEGKLLIISIGYAACHWCHVMEKESFEDTVVAKIMNEHFVSIKVDREERPDVDQIYMDAAQLITGRGGWPLNAIALPDGRPIFAGTYFPKQNWLSLLERVQKFYEETPGKAETQAQKLTEGIRAIDEVSMVDVAHAFDMHGFKEIFTHWKPLIDYELGGQKRAPKFPMPVGIEFLLNYFYYTGDQSAKEAAIVTLDNMALGGIYDQVGGGFARYSTDMQWKVPHFEKMLYDNGQLVSVYAKAYQLTGNPLYRKTVYETLEFVKRELTSGEYGFYSSLDADSEGEEGKFYVWKKSEVDDILGDRSELINDYYNISEGGNWEHGNNILYRSTSDDQLIEKYALTSEQIGDQVLKSNKLLLEARERRERPGLDDKILTSWNALMLKGYVDAYRAFDEPEFLETALKNADFLLEKMVKEDSRLNRNYKNEKASINAFLDDYAFLIEAFIALYQATFDEGWLFKADRLLQYTLTHFYNDQNGMFFYTSDIDPDLISRKFELADNVIPSSNSAMAKNLYILGEYLYKPDYIDKAEQMLKNVSDNVTRGGAYYTNWGMLMGWLVKKPFEVAIIGENFEEKRKALDKYFYPDVLLMGGDKEGKLPLLENKRVEKKTVIYVCQNKTCKLPVSKIEEAIDQLKR